MFYSKEVEIYILNWNSQFLLAPCIIEGSIKPYKPIHNREIYDDCWLGRFLSVIFILYSPSYTVVVAT
jgi:hypothetical protein